MKILKSSQKQFIKYLFFFIVAVFLVSNVFACHIYEFGIVDLDHDFSDSCHTEKESLVSQNESQFFATGNAIQTQNNQKFVLDFNSETSKKSSILVQQEDAFFVSSEDLDDSQEAQLLAVVKKE